MPMSLYLKARPDTSSRGTSAGAFCVRGQHCCRFELQRQIKTGQITHGAGPRTLPTSCHPPSLSLSSPLLSFAFSVGVPSFTSSLDPVFSESSDYSLRVSRFFGNQHSTVLSRTGVTFVIKSQSACALSDYGGIEEPTFHPVILPSNSFNKLPTQSIKNI
jgi:hypothetical protein